MSSKGHKPRWEQTVWARLSEPTQSAPHPGKQVHVWLEETREAAELGIEEADLLPAQRQHLRDSQWTIGLHCTDVDTPSWSLCVMMRLVGGLRLAQPPLVIEQTTGRVLADDWQEAAARAPLPLKSSYVIAELERDGLLWLYTRGLSRGGGFELELLGVRTAQRRAGVQLIEAFAALSAGQHPPPPPWRLTPLPDGTTAAWVPLEDVRAHLSPALPGLSPSDRSRLQQVTVLLVSPQLSPVLAGLLPPPTTAPSPQPAPDAPALSPLQAAGLSLLFPGGGQYLLGQKTKGRVMLGVALCTCGGLGLMNLLAAADAFFLTSHRQKRALETWEFFWSGPR